MLKPQNTTGEIHVNNTNLWWQFYKKLTHMYVKLMMVSNIPWNIFLSRVQLFLIVTLAQPKIPKLICYLKTEIPRRNEYNQSECIFVIFLLINDTMKQADFFSFSLICIKCIRQGSNFGEKIHKTAGLVAQNFYWTRTFFTRPESTWAHFFIEVFLFNWKTQDSQTCPVVSLLARR